MNALFDKLLKTDATALDELNTSTYLSKRLGKVLGQPEGVEITLQEIPYDRLNDIMNRQFDKKGKFDFKKSTQAKAQVALEGIKDPDLGSQELLDHFHCFKATDLVEKIFSMELIEISDEICRLSGFITGEDELEEEAEEIKN